MVVIDAETRSIISKKARLYDITKEQIEQKIKENIQVVINKLKAAEQELLDEVEVEFSDNPFLTFLESDNHTDDEIRNILSKEVPASFGPSEESFCSLCKEIESFKSWKESKTSPIDLIPQNLRCTDVTHDTISLSWDESKCDCFYDIELRSSSGKNIYHSTKPQYTFSDLKPSTEYLICVRTVITNNNNSMWRNSVTIKTKEQPFTWKRCPEYVGKDSKYSVDENNYRVATKVGASKYVQDKTIHNCYSTIIGNTPLPLNEFTSWNIKILKSDYNGNGIYVGVAPFDINQNKDGIYGWYIHCYDSRLCSGPHNNYNREYGPRKKDGKYVHTGDVVGVVMDITTKGKLSFVVNNVGYGVAFNDIPLDRPLVPCVLLLQEGDSVGLDLSEVKENIDCSIPVPSNITAKNGTTWDVVTFTWDGAVEDADFYQIIINETSSWVAPTTNSFTQKGFPPDTEYSFKMRAVKGNSVSRWSDVVKGRTPKELIEFSWWKKCPDNVWRKYSVDENNPRVASANGYCCTTIGNTFLLLNEIISWNIKILKSKKNDGGGISIGVAPFNIDQNVDVNNNKCGWYYNCFRSTLYSGPPHNYNYPGKEYGPRKEDGKYVHTGDIVGVIMNTTKGELSFVVNEVNLGVAYEGIPLDKPLVPCVLLLQEGDSIELIV